MMVAAKLKPVTFSTTDIAESSAFPIYLAGVSARREMDRLLRGRTYGGGKTDR